jgi:hypothetical protein
MNDLHKALSELNTKILEIQHLEGNEFSDAAQKIMENIQYPNPVTDTQVLEITHNCDHPKQYYGPKEFGEYNITVFYHDTFSIQVYLMNQIDTEFHDHGFVGAFQLLSGKNVQTCFEFNNPKEIEDGVEEGELKLVETKMLQAGDVYPLHENMIHQVSRLADKNITLMVMKNTEPRNFVYLPPKIKVDNKRLTQKFLRRLYALDYEYSHYKKFSDNTLSFFADMSLKELLYIAIRMANFPFSKECKEFILKLTHEQLDKKNYKHIVDDYLKFIQTHKTKTDLLKA